MLVLLGNLSIADASTHVADRGPPAGHDAERSSGSGKHGELLQQTSSDRSRLPTEAETSMGNNSYALCPVCGGGAAAGYPGPDLYSVRMAYKPTPPFGIEDFHPGTRRTKK